MSKINMESLVDMILTLRWESHTAHHTDCYQANGVNVWRDYFPPGIRESIVGREPGDRVDIELNAAGPYDPKKLLTLKTAQFASSHPSQRVAQPCVGRFYPKGLLTGVAGVYQANIQPFRCVALKNGNMTVDFNHPIAGRNPQLTCLIGKVVKKTVERGGTSVDWIETLTDGPGMQARWQENSTEFFSAHAFSRRDERPDQQFYDSPRLVQHIDDTAIEMVRHTYARFLTDDMHVLDLMSSWQSHVPKTLRLQRLAGLGLNAEELKRNTQLTEFILQDLNTRARLPFARDSFDAVLNTVSIEYLIDPVAVFKEVARVLRPGGLFVVTFSNRWFPTKSIRIWEELHEFERMGLVLEYFLRSGAFHHLNTYSIRGLPRPHSDRYYPDQLFADPVYAVWGQKA